MIMYNALFDFTNPNGLFSGDETGGTFPAWQDALKKSNSWLEKKGQPNPPNPFDPDDPNTTGGGKVEWEDLGRATTLLVHSNSNVFDICIRVAPLSTAAPSAAATLQLVVAFGKPAPFAQPQASPFTSNSRMGGDVVTTFVFPPMDPVNPPGHPAVAAPFTRNTSRGWYVRLGPIAKHTTKRRSTERYQFALGAIVTDTVAGVTTVRYYGEDPDLDVGD